MTNRTHGEHLSGKGGTSIEFSDFRDYVAGDDLRHVDWNIFSRLHRPYVKQFRYEEQMCVVILLDASTSMTFDGKFERARQIAAAFARLSRNLPQRPEQPLYFLHRVVVRQADAEKSSQPLNVQLFS